AYQEIAKMPVGANGLVGHCVRLKGGWKPFCEVEWQGWSGWASSCCMAELGEPTQFSYRVTQNLILRSNPDKSSWNLLSNYAPNDYIPGGTRFTWKSRPDAGNCAAGSGGEVWCRLTYTYETGIRTEGWVSAHFLRSTIMGRASIHFTCGPCMNIWDSLFLQRPGSASSDSSQRARDCLGAAVRLLV